MSSYISNIIDFSNFISSMRYDKNSNDSQVLDPFSCLIRLCLLNYKPIGTKLSFTNNKIIFQEPNFLQPAKRWSLGDSRLHIHNLYNPIFKLDQWYNINTKEFIYLLNKSKSGLSKLLQCYNANDSNIISHSINYYIETIDNILNKKNINNTLSKENFLQKENNIEISNESKNKKKKNKTSDNISLDIPLENNISNVNKEENNNVQDTNVQNTNVQNNNLNILNQSTDIYSIKLKSLWNINEINIIYLLLNEIESKEDTHKFNNSFSLILSIEEILKGKDEILNTIVNKISTSL